MINRDLQTQKSYIVTRYSPKFQCIFEKKLVDTLGRTMEAYSFVTLTNKIAHYACLYVTLSLLLILATISL